MFGNIIMFLLGCAIGGLFGYFVAPLIYKPKE